MSCADTTDYSLAVAQAGSHGCIDTPDYTTAVAVPGGGSIGATVATFSMPGSVAAATSGQWDTAEATAVVSEVSASVATAASDSTVQVAYYAGAVHFATVTIPTHSTSIVTVAGPWTVTGPLSVVVTYAGSTAKNLVAQARYT